MRGGRFKLVLPHRSQTLDGKAGTGGIPGKYRQADVPLALYDLVADIGETTDVAAAHPDVVARLQGLAEKAREDLGDSLTKRTGRGLREPGRAPPPWPRRALSPANALGDGNPGNAPSVGESRMAWEREIEVCRDVALRAGELALRHAARGVQREDKADDSPVTVADRECEQLIVSELRAAFPGDGFLGEEGADHGGRSGRRWIVDPIDGTRDFVRGLPTWSNLIALEVDGEVVLGTCNLAAQGELYWAVRGKGTFLNEQRVGVSAIDRRDRAIACLTAFDNVAASPFADRILDHLAGYWAVRSMGGCQDAMLVVSGRAEVWFEISAKAWDLAPLKILAEEAGARFFNFDGGRSIHGGNCVICAPFLEEELRAFVGARPSP